MPSLITADAVKADFPLWSGYLQTGGETPQALDDRLASRIAEAETQLLEYLPALTPAALTDPLRLHLLVLVRKRLFDVKHGNTAFQVKPQIVRDYEATVAMLERYRAGEFGREGVLAPDGSTDTFTLQSKPRRFDTWFTP